MFEITHHHSVPQGEDDAVFTSKQAHCLYKSRILLTQPSHSHYLNPSNALPFTTAGDSSSCWQDA